jgi:hypothetical protein
MSLDLGGCGRRSRGGESGPGTPRGELVGQGRARVGAEVLRAVYGTRGDRLASTSSLTPAADSAALVR